ncbi:SDR family oxidoreductase [Marinicella sp. S1101]|uniref:SDR family oxidoreductase n=1 Tax=Marinicella marina TaxID=2996016 RepID=UPI002260C6BA|nr:SDR family oxidoreductase [Marinicella marina]MCX7553652.1 SDR family oxidoreductase [Marinicella marina]MDJ1140276.1 SDR family oxidoreductase [Marinicella marina]
MIHPLIRNTLLIVMLSFSVIFNDVCALDMESHKGQAIGAGRAVLVTGASSGIGKQIAMTLADEGFYVYAGARKAKDIAALSAIENMQGIRLDVTIQSEIDAAVKEIEAAGRGLYGLVNNAGVFLFDPLIEVSERDMAFIMDVNVMGPYRVTKAFAPLIIKSQGRISTIGSVAGLFSGRLFGPYGMSKFAVEAYAEALADEMKKFNVAVSIIEPGNFKSDIMKNMAARLKKIDEGGQQTLYREEIERFATFTQADRSHHHEPQPVADAVLDFMISEKPQFRYLVTPNQAEADMTIKRTIQKLVKMNQGQRFRMSDEDLVAYLKSLLAAQ